MDSHSPSFKETQTTPHKKKDRKMCLPTDHEIIENMAEMVTDQWEEDAEEGFSDIDIEEEEEEEEEGGDDDPIANLTEDQIRIITRNATSRLLSNLRASIRFMRVDINRLTHTEPTATTAAVNYRMEDMERMIEAFEDNAIIRFQPRNLFE